LDIAKYISFALKWNLPVINKCIFCAIELIFNCKSSDTIDNLNAPEDPDTSWTLRVYMNKRKLHKKIKDERIYNQSNVFPQIELVLENIYLCITNSKELETNCIKALYTIFMVMGDKIGDYIIPVSNLLKNLLKLTDQGYSFSNIQFIFECLSIVIETIKNNESAQKTLLDTLLQDLNNLMNKQSNDLTSFLIQIYALIIKNFNTTNFKEKQLIFQGLLDDKNYQQD